MSWTWSQVWSKHHGGVQLIGLLLIACSACFLRAISTASPGMVPPSMGWAIPHQSVLKEIFHKLGDRAVRWGHILSWCPCSMNDSRLCQVDIKLTPHVWRENSSDYPTYMFLAEYKKTVQAILSFSCKHLTFLYLLVPGILIFMCLQWFPCFKSSAEGHLVSLSARWLQCAFKG